jgi:uncharacterized membrane protein YjjB (DUF3815 family)
MIERFLLAAIATFCFYLFFQLGNNTTKPALLGNGLTQVPNFAYSTPIIPK